MKKAHVSLINSLDNGIPRLTRLTRLFHSKITI